MKNQYKVQVLNKEHKLIAEAYVRGFAEAKIYGSHIDGAVCFCLTRIEEKADAWWLRNGEWVGITPQRFRQVMRKYNSDPDPFEESDEQTNS